MPNTFLLLFLLLALFYGSQTCSGKLAEKTTFEGTQLYETAQLCAINAEDCADRTAGQLTFEDIRTLSAKDEQFYEHCFDYLFNIRSNFDCTKCTPRLWKEVFNEFVGMATQDHISAAIELLQKFEECQAEGLIGTEERLIEPFSSIRAPYSNWQALPTIVHLLNMYQNRENTFAPDRTLLLMLLDRGLGAGWQSQYSKRIADERFAQSDDLSVVRPLSGLLKRGKIDIDLIERLIRNGANIHPSNYSIEKKKNQYSPMLALVADCNGKVDRPLMQVMYKINYNVTAGIALDDAVKNQDQDTEFHGNWGFFNSIRLASLPSFKSSLHRMVRPVA